MKRKVHSAFISLTCLLLIGCASSNQPSYQQNVASIPMPQTQSQLDAQCATIRSEISRQQSLSSASATMTNNPMLFQAMASQNIAALESKSAQIGCGAAFSSHSRQGNVDQPSKADQTRGERIQQCIDVCVKNTSRSPEECFDKCVD